MDIYVCLLYSCGEHPSSLAVQRWAYPWLDTENVHLHGDNDWFRGEHMTEAQPIRAFSRILAKTIKKLALSASEIVGAIDYGRLKLPRTVFFTPQRQFLTPPVQTSPEKG